MRRAPPETPVAERTDVVIVGGGPAGLAAAIELRRRGLSVLILERRTPPLDKACGEGVLPDGVLSLARLGVLEGIGRDARSPLERLRYVLEDGTVAEARLPAPGGMGIRRTALVHALAARARAEGARLLVGCEARAHHVLSDGVVVETDAGVVRARVLVGADGLRSRTRGLAGLDGRARATRGRRRLALRRHFVVTDADGAVEVHLGDGVEGYATPVGRSRLDVALLWWESRGTPPREGASFGARSGRFDALLARLPALAARVRGARPETPSLGAGPFDLPVARRVNDRVVLLGDAAGCVDPLTGEGLSLAFREAALLADVLPVALARGATAAALAPYDSACGRLFRRRAWAARLLLAVVQRAALRRRVLRALAQRPIAFDRLVEFALGSPSAAGG